MIASAVRGRWSLAGSVVLAGIALVAAASQVAPLAQVGYERVTAPSRDLRDADVDPFAYFAPTEPLVLAQQAIPNNATYSLAIGNDPPGTSAEIVRDLFQFWLLPRRFVARPADAQWVIVYHEPPGAFHVPHVKDISLGPAVDAVEVRR